MKSRLTTSSEPSVNLSVLEFEQPEAAELAQKAVRLRVTQWPGYACLASALGHLGRIEDAKKAMKELKDAQPQATVSFVKESAPVTDAGYVDHLLDGLRKAGLPE